MDTPEGKSPIRKSVRVLSPATKTNKGKSSRKSLEFVQERLHASEKENNDIDQGPVVQKPINANPRLNFNQGVYFSIPKCCSTLIFGKTVH